MTSARFTSASTSTKRIKFYASWEKGSASVAFKITSGALKQEITDGFVLTMASCMKDARIEKAELPNIYRLNNYLRDSVCNAWWWGGLGGRRLFILVTLVIYDGMIE